MPSLYARGLPGAVVSRNGLLRCHACAEATGHVPSSKAGSGLRWPAGSRNGSGRSGGGGCGGGLRGRAGRVRPGPGQRAAADPGGARARDRGGPPERGDGDPGAVQGEAQRASAGAPRRSVRGLPPEGGVRALRPDPVPHSGGHGAAPRGLQLLFPEGLPDGPQAHGLRPRQAGGPLPDLRADAGALAEEDAAPLRLPAPGTHGASGVSGGPLASALLPAPSTARRLFRRHCGSSLSTAVPTS